MDDLFTYFLFGMFGEEVLRKLATRPYGFVFLWLLGFILANIFVVVVLLTLGSLSLFSEGVSPDETVATTVVHFFSSLGQFFFVVMQPWGIIFSATVGLLFSMGYRWHYRHNHLK